MTVIKKLLGETDANATCSQHKGDLDAIIINEAQLILIEKLPQQTVAIYRLRADGRSQAAFLFGRRRYGQRKK